jgi:hypothetical protein
MADWLIGFANSLISDLGAVLGAIVVVLPKSPFTYMAMTPIEPYLGTLNYFIPISFMVSSGETWLTAIGIYYAVQGILRWVKADD